MAKVTYDYSKALKFVSEEEIELIRPQAEAARDILLSKKGAGSDFLGWLDLPEDYDKDEFARIKKAADKIRSDSEVLLVVGIGGSYLGARAAIEFLKHNFFNSVGKDKRNAKRSGRLRRSISSETAYPPRTYMT